jgi:hypothetical protein
MPKNGDVNANGWVYQNGYWLAPWASQEDINWAKSGLHNISPTASAASQNWGATVATTPAQNAAAAAANSPIATDAERAAAAAAAKVNPVHPYVTPGLPLGPTGIGAGGPSPSQVAAAAYVTPGFSLGPSGVGATGSSPAQIAAAKLKATADAAAAARAAAAKLILQHKEGAASAAAAAASAAAAQKKIDEEALRARNIGPGITYNPLTVAETPLTGGAGQPVAGGPAVPDEIRRLELGFDSTGHVGLWPAYDPNKVGGVQGGIRDLWEWLKNVYGVVEPAVQAAVTGFATNPNVVGFGEQANQIGGMVWDATVGAFVRAGEETWKTGVAGSGKIVDTLLYGDPNSPYNVARHAQIEADRAAAAKLTQAQITNPHGLAATELAVGLTATPGTDVTEHYPGYVSTADAIAGAYGYGAAGEANRIMEQVRLTLGRIGHLDEYGYMVAVDEHSGRHMTPVSAEVGHSWLPTSFTAAVGTAMGLDNASSDNYALMVTSLGYRQLADGSWVLTEPADLYGDNNVWTTPQQSSGGGGGGGGGDYVAAAGASKSINDMIMWKIGIT